MNNTDPADVLSCTGWWAAYSTFRWTRSTSRTPGDRKVGKSTMAQFKFSLWRRTIATVRSMRLADNNEEVLPFFHAKNTESCAGEMDRTCDTGKPSSDA